MIPEFPFRQSRTWLIVASAGCGKSWQIRKEILDLIRSGVHPSKIAYFIYNSKPAQEFRLSLQGQGILAEDIPWIGTHHAIALKLLKISSKKVISSDSVALKNWGLAQDPPFQFGQTMNENGKLVSSFWDDIMVSMDKKINDGTDNFDPHEQRLLYALKRSEDIDGIYTHTRYLAKAMSMRLVPQDVEYVFVDEGQDNCTIQFEYFEYLKSLDHIKGIMIVGDDKQAINLYRGARPDLFLNFKPDRFVCLDKTYRNSKKILDFANAIAHPILNRSPLTAHTNVAHPGIVERFPELQDSLKSIEEGIKAGKSIFLLARLNFDVAAATKLLVRAGIPVKTAKFDRLRDTVKTLKYFADKIQTSFFTYTDLVSILPKDEPEEGELNKTAYWKSKALAKFRSGNYDPTVEPELAIAFDRFLQKGSDLVFFNLDLQQFGFDPSFLEDMLKLAQPKPIIPKGVFRGIDDADIDYFQRMVDKYGLDYSSVVPMTIHASKGSEADYVVMLDNINYQTEQSEMYDPDSERRVYYVGATRAREKLILTSIYREKGTYTSLLP